MLRYGTWTPRHNYTGILETVEFDSNDNCTNKLELLHPMLQYGNAPTAWNASSGDYLTQESAKSLFSQTADEIKTEVTKSVTETVTANVKDTATSAANDAVDSKLQDYATTATVESLKEDVSNISQKADSISTKVSSLKETTGSEVHVDYKGGKGVLHIAFYSDAQLQQFAGLLGQYDPEQAAEAADPSGEDEA